MAKWIVWFAHPRLMFWLMPLLMLLLVAGTIAQREIGLYEAERRFFASWVLWVYGVPLPAMYTLLALLSAGLIAKLILKSPFTRANSGNVITHMGALLLMLGGLLTAISAEEGYLGVAEGASSRMVHDYHARELVLLNAKDETIWRAPHDDLQSAAQLNVPDSPLRIEVLKVCRNCLPAHREELSKEVYQGIASQVTLTTLPLELQDEANMAGLELRISGLNEEQSGVYLLFEPMQNLPELSINGETMRLAVRKTQRMLPFEVKLLDFEKQIYAGTDTAREYQSQVQIDEGNGIVWQTLIRMNEPLRVMGYTLYQSSFLERGGETLSVLAVVKNKGRVFPYVASLVIGLGIVWHLRVRRRRV